MLDLKSYWEFRGIDSIYKTCRSLLPVETMTDQQNADSSIQQIKIYKGKIMGNNIIFEKYIILNIQ